MKEYEAVGVLTKTVYATGDYVAVRRSLIEKFPSCEYTEHCKAKEVRPVYKESIKIQPVKKGVVKMQTLEVKVSIPEDFVLVKKLNTMSCLTQI